MYYFDIDEKILQVQLSSVQFIFYLSIFKISICKVNEHNIYNKNKNTIIR